MRPYGEGIGARSGVGTREKIRPLFQKSDKIDLIEICRFLYLDLVDFWNKLGLEKWRRSFAV